MAERASTGPPRGRRRGSPDTRSAILAAARSSFAEHGFAGTTIRAVAASAGVDAALVHHYFGTKDELFLAALELPVDPRKLIGPAVAGPVEQAAERFLGVFLSVWDDPDPSVRWMWRSRSPSRCAISTGGDCAIAAWERSMVALA